MTRLHVDSRVDELSHAASWHLGTLICNHDKKALLQFVKFVVLSPYCLCCRPAWLQAALAPGKTSLARMVLRVVTPPNR